MRGNEDGIIRHDGVIQNHEDVGQVDNEVLELVHVIKRHFKIHYE